MLALFAVLGLVTLPAQAARLDGLEAEVDAFVAAHAPNPDSGIALGVVENGKLVFFKGYGYRDREKKLPVTANTVFGIGSCTKSFTSLALNMLADEGKVSLESPVRSLMPDFTLSDEQVSREATFVDLLSHHTGLPRHDLLWYLTPFTDEELYGRLRYLALDKHPGMGFREALQYNNLMFMTLGRAVRVASGEPWESFVRERILDALGMKATQFSVEDSQKGTDFARPYQGASAMNFYPIVSVASAGAINSTVNDLVHWVAFLQSGGGRLLSETRFHDLFQARSHSVIPGVPGAEFDYGLGWMLNQIEGRRVIWHGGNIDGFSAHVSVLEGTGLGLILLTNENDASAFEYPWKVTKNGKEIALLPYLIYEHLLGASASTAGAVELRSLFTAAHLPRSVLPFTSLALPTETYFYDLGYGRLGLKQDESGAYSLHYYNATFPLVATNDPLVFSIPEGDLNWTVKLEKAGDVITAVSVPFEPEVDPIRFVK